MSATFRSCAGRCVVVGMSTQHCSVCHGDFKATGIGDAHRTGEYDNPSNPRRCRTADEMTERGYVQDEHGRWGGPPMPDDVKAKRFGVAS